MRWLIVFALVLPMRSCAGERQYSIDELLQCGWMYMPAGACAPANESIVKFFKSMFEVNFS
jgi:hypothetical protein